VISEESSQQQQPKLIPARKELKSDLEAVVMPLIILKPALEQIEVQHSHKVVEASEE
jgi:hypothetical protein